MKNTLVKRVELCNSLNMNFDAASENFQSESLSFSKMAQVNGGINWRAVYEIAKLIITGTATGVAVDAITEKPKEKKTEKESSKKVIIEKGEGGTTVNGIPADSVNIAIGSNGSSKIYIENYGKK